MPSLGRTAKLVARLWWMHAIARHNSDLSIHANMSEKGLRYRKIGSVECGIRLACFKYSSQVDLDEIDGLSLTFVNGHGP